MRRIDEPEAAARKAGSPRPHSTLAVRKSVEPHRALLEKEAPGCGPPSAGRRHPGAAGRPGPAGEQPGVGRRTAATVLAELPAVHRLPSAQSAAAYCGLSPREFTSGSSVRKKTRLSKAGNPRLRKALFLPTQTAVRFNPLLRGFFERLVAGGKPKMQAVGACMRKLVMICYGYSRIALLRPDGPQESPLDNTLPGSAVLALRPPRDPLIVWKTNANRSTGHRFPKKLWIRNRAASIRVAERIKLTCPAAVPITTTTSREASGNKLRGWVRCCDRFGPPLSRRGSPGTRPCGPPGGKPP